MAYTSDSKLNSMFGGNNQFIRFSSGSAIGAKSKEDAERKVATHLKNNPHLSRDDVKMPEFGDEPKSSSIGSGFRPSAPSKTPEKQTAAGRLDEMLKSDSSLMKRAATQGTQVANSRGLLNSSMAAEASQGAMIDRASPLALQDSNNMYRENQFNASEQNKFGLQANDFLGRAQLAEQQYGFQSALSDQGYQQNLGLNEQGFQFDMGKMQQEYGFNSELSTQEAQQSLDQLYATSTANGWGVMANNLTDIIGQYSSQLERIQMNPDIDEETKTSLIEDVLSMRDADLDFQRSMYDQLPNYLANTGVFPNR